LSSKYSITVEKIDNNQSGLENITLRNELGANSS